MLSVFQLPDIDQLEGGKKVVTFDSPTLHDLSDEELGLGPVKPKAPNEQRQVYKLPLKRTAQQKAVIENLNGNPENGIPHYYY